MTNLTEEQRKQIILDLDSRATNAATNKWFYKVEQFTSDEEKIKYVRGNDDNYDKLMTDIPTDDVKALMVAIAMLEVLGLENSAFALRKATARYDLYRGIEPVVLGAVVNDETNNRISEKNRSNAQGPRHRHYDDAIKIMRDTWGKYPNASKNGMVEKLHSHFNEEVSRQSLQKWIKDNELGQHEKVRPSPPFNLVIT
ncbi:hypothetical protein PEC302110_33920 [Pectobacterium araliae]|uniref:Uncharacterized protein n=1 Tax=Pectobacterium araliae TaxID=3073862 RepID=A0AAN0MN17_9GAMM|nr:hypothetical protein PEC302110_33920 [Pectobacterium sp. MAFF 302110]